MQTISIYVKDTSYSTIYFATKLVSEVSTYESEVILKSISENKVSQAVDLKSILGVSALLNNKSDVLTIEICGYAEKEKEETNRLNKFIINLLKEASN